MRFIVQVLLFVLFAVGPNFSGMGQSVVVERSKNKVVVKGVKYYLHVVKEKETLFAISKAYGVQVSELMRINRKTSAAVSIDEVLRIPELVQTKAVAPLIVKKEDANFIYHLVEKGETLFSLSRKYHVEQSDLVAVNPGADVSLPLGSTLKIPKAKIQLVDQKKTQVLLPKVEGAYYYHVVAPGETEFSICRKYGLKLRKFRKLNHSVKADGLKLGTYVRIPKNLAPEIMPAPVEVVEEEPQVEEKEVVYTDDEVQPAIVHDKIDIALLLPLYLEANDTLNWVRTYVDTVEVIRERKQKIIYSRSRDFIRFYQGVLMAVDTLQKQGVSIDLHVYDTEKSTEKVQQILSKPEFDSMDLVIGPVYSNTFNLAADFAKERQIPIVSPLSAKNSKLKTNPFILQLNTTLPTLCEKMAEYVTQRDTNINLVVVHQTRYKHLNEYKLVSDLEHELFEKGSYWNTEDIYYKKLSFEEYGLYGLEYSLVDSCENIILLPSTSQPVVDNIVTQLNVLSERFQIRLMGFPVWQRYNSMDPVNFFNLNTTLLSPYYIEYNDEKVDHFIRNFRSNFGVEPNDFSFRGYDMCLYFSKAISQYGKFFLDHLKTVNTEQLQGSFEFERVGNFGGFENRGLHLINFGRDYKINHSKAFIKQKEVEEYALPVFPE